MKTMQANALRVGYICMYVIYTNKNVDLHISHRETVMDNYFRKGSFNSILPVQLFIRAVDFNVSASPFFCTDLYFPQETLSHRTGNS